MSEFAFESVPFSTFGSFVSIANLRADTAPGGVAGIYLRRVQGVLLNSAPVGRLVLVHDGAEVATTVHADATLLCLTDERGGRVEVSFDGPRTLRLRGTGVGLRIVGARDVVTASEAAGRATFNAGAVRRRYEFESLAGGMALAGHWRDATEGIAHLDLLPGDGGRWEAAVDEYTSTWTPRERRPFEETLAGSRRAFDAWLDGMPRTRAELVEARRLAAYVLWSCVVEPEGLLTRPTVLMSMSRMCSVWAWDNCFNALALVRHHPALAWDQLLLFMDHQDEFGAYPDVINTGITIYNYVKPPVHGWTVLEMLRRNPDAPDRDVLERVHDSLGRWTRWWLDHRRLPGQSLPHYLHGNDAGWDNNTIFDAGVPVVTPDLAAALVTQMDALSDLARRFGKDSEAKQWKEQADNMLAALLDELWTGGRFVARLALTGEPVVTRSLIYAMPIILAERLPKNVVGKLIVMLRDHLTAHGLASEHPDSPEYRASGYWRGPIWAPATYMPAWALDRLGAAELARTEEARTSSDPPDTSSELARKARELAGTIAERYCAMCANNGFAEYFDALTGLGLGDHAYSWTASVFLLLAERLHARRQSP
ncbi:MAG: glycogen debranching protein [Verrucomicrobia bacterium]|nr:glycogen debranching protein [Verrucomicrobiota bacterium]